ncbi:hypothetical protein C1H46_039526 [Malus baccata]|uniref:Uncharacterized protein n=1 Tax=Malus baccata TaxID=106549 RepID=A0A540KL56_MALBA|nr:hypothetical protein C1H46_039526 [Malus baccata]
MSSASQFQAHRGHDLPHFSVQSPETCHIQERFRDSNGCSKEHDPLKHCT